MKFAKSLVIAALLGTLSMEEVAARHHHHHHHTLVQEEPVAAAAAEPSAAVKTAEKLGPADAKKLKEDIAAKEEEIDFKKRGIKELSEDEQKK